jgi:thiamine biosynthesis lipoprotein
MQTFDHIELCMGTGFRFQGRCNDADLNAAMAAACEILHEADRVFSLYKPESPLSQLAAGKTSVAECPAEVAAVWDECEQWEKITDGWFSPFTAEHTFDPSGLVKTWAAKRAGESLLASGIKDFTLNAGGDVYISDSASGESDWRIAVSKPVSIADAEAGALAVVDLTGTQFRAMATSGSAERGSHIWSPKSDVDPAKAMLQVSVLAKDLVEADVWATAAFAEGPSSLARIDALPDLEVFAILADGQIAATPGFMKLVLKS